MIKTLIAVLVLAVLGIGASLYLIPRTPELALINFKDKRFDEARAAYEQQLKEGRITPEVVNTLVDLDLQIGALDQAIGVMEQYLAKNPADLAARQRLGQLYQFAQRPEDYLRNLEEISRLKPSPEVYSELSQIYNFTSQYDKQVEALKQLIAMEKETNPQHYIDLAHILASRANKPEAIDALLKLKEHAPDAFTFREMELLVSLLLDEKRVEEAYALSLQWRQKNPPPPAQEVARLVNLLHFKGAPAYAEKLLDSYDQATLDSEPYLLQEKVLLDLEQGKEEQAYARLKALSEQGKLDAALQNRLLFLAVARGDEPTAKALLRNLDVKTLNEAEALTLLELSLARGDASMQQRLAAAFSDETYKANYPALSAMLALARHERDADARLTTLEKADLTAQQNLQVARICLRLKAFSCSETFLSRLPAPEQMSDAEAAAVGNLYFDLGAYDKGYAFVQALAQARDSAAIRAVRVKFLAVRGDERGVDAWLSGEGKDASTRTLTDLYFAAYNHHHPRLAVAVATLLYGREQTPQTRSMLASAYVAGGEYARAVSLLRGARNLSAADENNYLLSLTKLARTSPAYRRELGAYAGSRLNAGLPYQRKMALIYALIAADQLEPAMPYIRVLALKNGGQWAWLYADRLTRAGRYDEARQFWVQLASAPSTSPAQRRTIAFNLLAGGYTQDALPIFQSLAERAPPSSPDVQRLLYLWGPRLNAEQLDWLATRFDNAASDAERGQWAEYIGRDASADDIVGFAEQRHPETLFAPPVLRAYLAALARSGELKAKHAALLKGITEHGDPELLRIYAENARSFNYTHQAFEAYQALFQLRPGDSDALRNLGILAFASADYSASRMYLEEYIRSDEYKSPADIQIAAYYYAELLRHARGAQAKAATAFYQKTASEADANNLTSPDALSKKAQSLIWAGQAEQGLATFHDAMQRYPNDDLLRGDYISMLIELKRYDEARAELTEPLQRLAAPAPMPQALPLPDGLMAQSISADGTEARLTFASENDVPALISGAQEMPWTGYVSEGYRQVLITAKPGYTLTLNRDAAGTPMLVATPAATDEARRQMRLRYELLAARVELETGQVYAANERLNALMPDYPQDTQLMGFAANAAYYGGNWHRAQELLDTARPLAPENEDIALLERDIRRSNSPHVLVDEEWVQRGSISHEWITTGSASANASKKLEVGVIGQDDHVTEKNVRRANGRIGSFSGNAPRGEIFARYHTDESWAKASLFANGHTPGLGLYYEFLNPLGKSGAEVEYHRSYWEYVEGVLDGATRDRISVWHEIQPSTQWDIKLEPGVNRYNTARFDDVGSSLSLTGKVVYRPVEDIPYLYIAYGLDAEYFRDKRYRQDAFGIAYQPLPVRTREIHFLSLNSGYEFSRDTYAQGMLGYAYDRHGGSGPVVEARLTHEFTDQLDVQLRAYYGVDTSNTNDNMARLGGYVRWRF
ncbi:MAG: tetratricopeptide repeat protein [Alphaproteobacteria bacterium]|nr:tetratricopeptide repeat protein [Alphaproteobacteria bacterium]